MRTYIEDLRQALKRKKITDEAIEEIIEDHEEMIGIALNEGLAESDIASKFGDPVKIAEELAETTENSTSNRQDKWNVHSTYELTDEKLSIDVHLVNENIFYRVGEEKHLVLRYYSERPLKGYDISFENGLFTLHAPSRKTLSFMSDETVEFILDIPEALMIDSLSHKGVNTDSDFQGLVLERLVVDTTNGDLGLKAVRANQTTIHSVNGDLSFGKCTFKELEISSVSGDAKLVETHVENRFKWHAVSGDLMLASTTCDECLFDVVSGDIKGSEFYPNTLSFKSVSGDLDVSNLKDFSHASWKTKSLSGDVSFH